MAIKNVILAEQVKTGMLFEAGAYRVGVVKSATLNSEGLIRVVWFDAYNVDFDKYDHYLPSDQINVVQGVSAWPSPLAMSERLLEWQRRGAQFTASGYGTKIPTSKVIKWSDGRERRVYCDIYSNAGSCYCMIHGCKVSVDGFNLISEATK